MAEVKPPLDPSTHKIGTAPSPVTNPQRKRYQLPTSQPFDFTQARAPHLLIPFPISLLLALILPIFAIAPLFYPGYLQTHTGFMPLWNVADLRANLGDWDWLPHLATSFDPLRSDGLLPYYLAALLPVSPVIAVKIVMGLSLLLGGLGMFLWLRSWLGQPGALVSALVYTYLPHQLATLYARGAWGETLFLGLLPWAMLVTTYLTGIKTVRVSKILKVWTVPLAALLWLLLGLSQLGLSIWAFLFLLLLVLAVHFSNSLLPMIAALVGLVMASLILFTLASPLPAFVIFSDHFLYPAQLFSVYWGLGASRPGWNDGLSLQLGSAAFGLTMLTIILWRRQNVQRVSRGDRRLWFFLGTALILTLLQLGLASFIWRLPFVAGQSLSSSLTFPWQLLSLSGLCLAVLAGAALWLDEALTRLPLFAATVLFIILSSYNYLAPQYIQTAAYDGPEVLLGQNELALLDHQFSVVTAGHTAGLDPGQTTVPLAIHGPMQANETLLVELVWQPLQTFRNDLKVFAHLVDPHDNVIAQFDGQPQGGDYPTSRWIPGELIEDTYPILLPKAMPPGPYRLFIGLYDEVTFARLPVATDSEGRVILDIE